MCSGRFRGTNSLAVFVSQKALRIASLAPNHLKPRGVSSDRFHVQASAAHRSTVNQSAPSVLCSHRNSVRMVGVVSDLPGCELKLGTGMPKGVWPAQPERRRSQDRIPSAAASAQRHEVAPSQYARKIDQALRCLLVGKETPLISRQAPEPDCNRIYAKLADRIPALVARQSSHNPETRSACRMASNARSSLMKTVQR